MRPWQCPFLIVIVVLVSRLGTLAWAEGPEPGIVGTAFPTPINTESDRQSQPLTPDAAARGFRVPAEFEVTVFAAEPDVQNPVAMAWDHRGRLWVAENYTYADSSRKFDLSLRDRILIFEDTDGDGRQDSRTVFTDDLQMVSSVLPGPGGVWVLALPQLIFIPDTDQDDRPDGAAVVLLDGFTPATDNHHTFANGLKWGPDGWLYGRCGASSPGRVGPPGTPQDARVPLFGGVWRYRPPAPTGKPPRVEVLCHGTTNPWGMDWNESGEAFFINTVNGHLWHVIPGAHFRRPHSEDPNPDVYETIDTHADHYHWDTGKDWTDSRKVTGEHDRLGGGHAHCGATIYLGDNWPDTYRGRLMTLNLHGRRVNVDRLEREGSGYVGRHEPDLLQSADPWFRGIELDYGPGGSLFLLDWSDTGECHEHTGVHRTSGRIFRVSYRTPRSPAAALRILNGGDMVSLAELTSHPNEWFVRHARRRLVQGLATADATSRDAVFLRLQSQLESADTTARLRALYTLWCLNAVGSQTLVRLLQDRDPHVRANAVRLLTEDWPLDTIFGEPHPDLARTACDAAVVRELVHLAAHAESGLVRLVLASTLQRLPVDQRLALATPLAARAEDANDHNLPLMIWYGLLPLGRTAPERLAEFALSCRLPTTRRCVSRRIAATANSHPRALEILLADPEPADILQGLQQGFAGRHRVAAPAHWSRIVEWAAGQPDGALRDRVRDLSVLFGDGRALDEVRRVALNSKADLATRRTALESLIDSRAPDRRAVCEQLLGVRYLNTTAIRGLTEFEDPAIGDKLAQNYRRFFPSDRPAVIEALVSRPTFAPALLDQIAAGKIARTDLLPAQARQIRSFDRPELTARLTEVWGELRDSPADKQALVDRLKQDLTPESLAAANLSAGRATFNRLCASCHRLYGHGGQVGPDLTGSGRRNLDYNLMNLIDPSATVGAEYRMSVAVLKDGRVLNGIVVSRTESTVVLQTARDRFTLAAGDIEELQASSQSLMPEGQLQTLSGEQIRDLIGYLMAPTQVPLPD